MKLPSLKRASLKGKIVLLRLDLNIAFARGRILDDFDIISVLPTLRYLLKRGATVVILSHRGRPQGKRFSEFTMKPVMRDLERRLKEKCFFLEGPPGVKLRERIEELRTQVRLFFLENLRFWSGEERNDFRFAKQLSYLGDIYVNDAFGNSHRAHASMVTLPKLLPAFAGWQLLKEVTVLSRVREVPVRPFVMVLGGAKISTKIDLIRYALEKADAVLVGGALANALLVAKGIAIGKSFIEPAGLEVLSRLDITNPKLHLPVDVTVAGSPTGKAFIKGVGSVGSSESIYDIGPDTLLLFETILRKARMAVWNGPLGFFEVAKFKNGTEKIAKILSASRCLSVIGGGETTATIRRLNLEKKMYFISSGGGAMVEFLVGKKLPGIEVLLEKPKSKYKKM